jgi:hypothetical protein
MAFKIPVCSAETVTKSYGVGPFQNQTLSFNSMSMFA